jgi:hypothetical protein
MALTAVFLSGTLGPESRRTKRASELWSLTGTASVAITTRYIKKPVAAIGAVTYSISGQVITVTALTDPAGNVMAIEIIGDL